MQTYDPQIGDIYLMMGICGFLFVVLTWLAFRLNRNKHPDPRRRVLMPMICYFMALLALMGFLGGFWSTLKYPTVSITEQHIIMDDTEYPLPRPGDVRLESYTGGGLNATTRVLLVHTRNRRTWAFPDDRYPVNEMLRQLRPAE